MRSLVAIVSLTALLALVPACKKKPKVIVIDESEVAGAGEEEAAIPATEDNEADAAGSADVDPPEPKLDPEEPREKFELIWKTGKPRLDSIYLERSEMIANLKRLKLADADEKATIDGLIPRLTEFGMGRKPAQLEKAAEEICKFIGDVRQPAEALIDKGEEHLREVKAVTAELDQKAEQGGTVMQRQWDELDKQSIRWSAPVTAGKYVLLVLKSILEEAYVLADLGPRRAQVALRDCLREVAEKPLRLELAQEQLEKTIERARYYRGLPRSR